jgi:hypothetical protein
MGWGMKIGYSVLMLASASTALFAGPNDSNWVQMLRKGDTNLSDWTPKIQGHAAGENPYNSFSYAETSDGQPRLIVTDTVTLSGSYGYGHLFYKTPYSDYLARVQYHFPTKQSFAAASGTWTIQNNGLMLHCQSAASMSQGQDYPQSVETQLLGYWSTGSGSPPNTTTANVCVVNTTVNYKGQWYSDATGHHCTQSKAHSLAYDSMTTTVKGANSTNATWSGKDIWEYTMVRVLDSTSITYWNRNKPEDAWDSVMGFTNIRKGQASSASSPGNTTALGSGYISIQMEGTTTEFAKIEILNLVGCMTKGDTAYRAYFVKDSAKACSGVTTIASLQTKAGDVFTLHGSRIQAASEIIAVEVFDVKGARVSSWRGAGRSFMDIGELHPGLYNLRVQTRGGTAQAVYAKM